MRLLPIALAAAALTALLPTAPAGARVKQGLYKGRTSEGLTVKVRVRGARVTASAKLAVDCIDYSGFDPTAPGVRSSYTGKVSTGDGDEPASLDGDGFAWSFEALESGTGGTSSERSFDGSFRGSRVEGNIAFELGGSSAATGSSRYCGGAATYTARRVPGT
jgi:hypothetical protein